MRLCVCLYIPILRIKMTYNADTVNYREAPTDYSCQSASCKSNIGPITWVNCVSTQFGRRNRPEITKYGIRTIGLSKVLCADLMTSDSFVCDWLAVRSASCTIKEAAMQLWVSFGLSLSWCLFSLFSWTFQTYCHCSFSRLINCLMFIINQSNLTNNSDFVNNLNNFVKVTSIRERKREREREKRRDRKMKKSEKKWEEDKYIYIEGESVSRGKLN